MARVTVEDCLKNVKNRFDLVLKAAKRAHVLELGGADPLVPIENDKPTVLALREIAAGFDVENPPKEEEDEIEETAEELVVKEETSTVFERPAESEDSAQ